MSQADATSVKTIFHKTPLIALAALPLTVGAVMAQHTAPAAQNQPQQNQPRTVQQARKDRTNHADAY